MPQAADAGDPTGLTQTPAEAAAGAINYLAPEEDDAAEGPVQERWAKLAGLDLLKS